VMDRNISFKYSRKTELTCFDHYSTSMFNAGHACTCGYAGVVPSILQLYTVNDQRFF